MGEIQSVITRTKRDGEQEGLYLTNRDVDFIKFAARWWCVSADHYIRRTYPQSVWNDIYCNASNVAWRQSRYHSITRRMNKLAKLDHYPMLEAGRVDKQQIAYWSTNWGGDLIGAPWSKYPSGNVQRARHAWAACDLGMALERLGYVVYSEREFANGNTVDYKEVMGGKFLNALEDSKATNKDHGMRPDMALPCTVTNSNGDEEHKFIFVEVERDYGGNETKYRNKLKNYYANDRVAAVWYVMNKQTTAQRVKKVNNELKLESREMPVRVMKMVNHHFGYVETPGFKSNVFKEDVERFGAIRLPEELVYV